MMTCLIFILQAYETRLLYVRPNIYLHLYNYKSIKYKINDNIRPTKKCVGARVCVEEVPLTSIQN